MVGGVAGWSVYEVFAVGWQLWVAVWAIELLFWGGRRLAVGGVGGVWLGTWSGGWCWWYICHWVGVGFVGWWLVGGGVGLVRVCRGEITLSVQDLVCDGGCWVAVDRVSCRVLDGEWHGCRMMVGLRCGFVFRR